MLAMNDSDSRPIAGDPQTLGGCCAPRMAAGRFGSPPRSRALDDPRHPPAGVVPYSAVTTSAKRTSTVIASPGFMFAVGFQDHPYHDQVQDGVANRQTPLLRANTVLPNTP